MEVSETDDSSHHPQSPSHSQHHGRGQSHHQQRQHSQGHHGVHPEKSKRKKHTVKRHTSPHHSINLEDHHDHNGSYTELHKEHSRIAFRVGSSSFFECAFAFVNLDGAKSLELGSSEIETRNPHHRIPSENPVKASILQASNEKTDDFIVHYNRYADSRRTVDSKHESHYHKHGLPARPKYNADGRRFTGSSESDPDYDHKAFKKQAEELNAKKSDSDEEHDHKAATPATTLNGNKVHPETDKKKEQGCFQKFMSCLCCCSSEPKPKNAARLPVKSRIQVNSSGTVVTQPRHHSHHHHTHRTSHGHDHR